MEIFAFQANISITRKWRRSNNGNCTVRVSIAFDIWSTSILRSFMLRCTSMLLVVSNCWQSNEGMYNKPIRKFASQWSSEPFKPFTIVKHCKFCIVCYSLTVVNGSLNRLWIRQVIQQEATIWNETSCNEFSPSWSVMVKVGYKKKKPPPVIGKETQSNQKK